MKIWIGGEIEVTIADEFRLSRNEVKAEINSLLSNQEYVFPADSWDVIAIIRNDVEFKELTKYSEKKRDMDFRLVVSYNEFLRSTHIQRKDLLLSMLLRSLKILKDKTSENGLDNLIEDIKKVKEGKL